MAKTIVQIPYVTWRDGKPRFTPSPQMRAKGIEPATLRHANTKAWFTIRECEEWSDKQVALYKAARDGFAIVVPQAGGQPTTTEVSTALTPLALPQVVRRAGAIYSFEALFADYFNSGVFKKLATKTQKDYRGKAKAMGIHDPELYVSAVEDVKREKLHDLWETIDGKGSAHQAVAILRVISLAISWGLDRGKLPGLSINPCLKLGMAAGEPRIRVWTEAEIDHVVKTADVMNVPEIGDAIILGIWTGQRQNDRLAMEQGPVDEYGRRRFVQSKTGAIVEIFEAPELATRLAAAAERKAKMHEERKAKGNDRPMDKAAIISTATQQAFKPDHYRHLFSDVVRAAYKGLQDEAGKVVIKPMPSMMHHKTGLPRDQDLRDTCVTWLANAGCSHFEIAEITGHSLQSIATILKHYLARDPVRSDNAIAKLRAYRQR